MENSSSIKLVIDALVAIGTIAVAVLAIWGDWFRDKFASPEIEISLRDTKGNLTTLNGRRAIYYHLIVQNRRKWALARGVQVMITGIWRRAADGSFKPESLAVQLPLTWAFPQFNPITPRIRDRKICDLGFVVEGDSQFKPSPYFYPHNFRGFVTANDAVRLALEIEAENFTSKIPYVVEICWDGQWTDDLEEMEKHLVIKQIGTEPSPQL